MIPFFDLKRQYEGLKRALEAGTLQAVRSGRYILGPSVRQFENAFAKYCGAPFGVGVGSGTDALIFSLKALGIKRGDEVIIPSFTFIATAFSVIHLGARPVLADVDLETYTLDPESIARLVGAKTRALLPVHLFGQMAAMDSIKALAKKYRLKIVEDACQAHGASWKGKKAGAWGDLGCFSFYPTKNLGAFGDGGMVITHQSKTAERIVRMRNLGRKVMSDLPAEPAWTSRLDALQAAVLSRKLQHLDAWNRSRRRLVLIYRKRLLKTPLILPKEPKDSYAVYHQFVVRVPENKQKRLQEFLRKRDIETAIYYETPVDRQPSMRGHFKRGRLSNTERLCREVLALPMFPELKAEEAEQVSHAICDFYR